MTFKEFLLAESQIDPAVQEIADKWFRPDGSAKTRAMTETMIADVMASYDLNLREAAKLFEKALLFYSDEHVVGGPKAYWDLVERLERGQPRRVVR